MPSFEFNRKHFTALITHFMYISCTNLFNHTQGVNVTELNRKIQKAVHLKITAPNQILTEKEQIKNLMKNVVVCTFPNFEKIYTGCTEEAVIKNEQNKVDLLFLITLRRLSEILQLFYESFCSFQIKNLI